MSPEEKLHKAVEEYVAHAHPSKVGALPAWLLPLIMTIIKDILAAFAVAAPPPPPQP